MKLILLSDSDSDSSHDSSYDSSCCSFALLSVFFCPSLLLFASNSICCPCTFCLFSPLCLRTLIETFGGQRCCTVGVAHSHTQYTQYTQFYTFFLRLACTCNAALFNIKWRLIPGSTSSQSTHTRRDPDPDYESFLPSARFPVEAVKCSSSSSTGGIWGLPLGLFACLQAAEMSQAGAGAGAGAEGAAYEWGWAANVIATTFDCLADTTDAATAASMSMGHAKCCRSRDCCCCCK